MPNRKPTDCGSQFRLLEDPISPPIWRVVFPIINRKLKKVENSYEKRAMLKTGTCMANSSLAHLNPLGVVRQSATPMGMHQANKAVEIMPDTPATTRCCWREWLTDNADPSRPSRPPASRKKAMIRAPYFVAPLPSFTVFMAIQFSLLFPIR